MRIANEHAWQVAHSAHITAYAPSETLLRDDIREAEFSLLTAFENLNKSPGNKKTFLFIFDDPNTWNEKIRPFIEHPNALAFSQKNKAVLYRDGFLRKDLTDVSHEMVHIALWHAYKNTLPLWLNEGLALHWGSHIAQQYFRLQGRLVSPQKKESMPESSAHDHTFLQEAKKRAQALEEQLGKKEFLQHLEKLAALTKE